MSLLKRNLFSLLCFVLVFPLSPSAQGAEENFKGAMNDMVTVVAAGVGGAVLGLSTLSFVEEPEDHLKNIVVGGAIGIIVGVGVVAWSQANKSSEYYNREALTLETSPQFTTAMRSSWHKRNHFEIKGNLAKKREFLGSALNFQFSF